MMQLLSELKTPFRWYRNQLLTSWKNPECSKYRYKLITPKDRLLPFVFRFPTPSNPSLPDKLRIYVTDTGVLQETVADNFTHSYIDYYRYDDWDYLVWKGDRSLDLDLPSGFYYAEIEMLDGTKYWSEEFWVDCDSDGNTIEQADYSDDFNDDFSNTFTQQGILSSLRKYTKLTWWHRCDIGNLLYQSGYVNMLYVDADLIKGEPEILEEGEEDGEKNFIPSFVKLIENINYQDYLPEHVIHALNGVGIHEYIYATSKIEQHISRVRKFQINYSYDSLCHGKAEVKYQAETIMLRSQCCGNNTIENIYTCPTIISALIYNAADNGDGTSSVTISWGVVTGPGPFTVMSPQVSGGAPNDTSSTTFDLGDFAHGTQVYVSVKPKCTAANGRTMYGNELTLTIAVP